MWRWGYGERGQNSRRKSLTFKKKEILYESNFCIPVLVRVAGDRGAGDLL
jgi:hypothetical protein